MCHVGTERTLSFWVEFNNKYTKLPEMFLLWAPVRSSAIPTTSTCFPHYFIPPYGFLPCIIQPAAAGIWRSNLSADNIMITCVWRSQLRAPFPHLYFVWIIQTYPPNLFSSSIIMGSECTALQ